MTQVEQSSPSPSTSPAEPIDADRTRPRGLGPVLQPQASVTLVEGSSFCVSQTNGDIQPQRTDGLFVLDTRVLSRWQLRIDSHEVEPLGVLPAEPYECRFVGRIPARPGQIEPTVVVERHRMVGQGMREDLTITNHGREAAGLDIVMLVDADFADLFEVKERRPTQTPRITTWQNSAGLQFRLDTGGIGNRGVRVSAPDAQATHGALSFRAIVAPAGSWTTSIEVLPAVEGSELTASFPLDRPLDATEPAMRMRGWHAANPAVSVENTVLTASLATSQRDLGALRLIDPAHPEDEAVAAGAPWFMTLFGRDSLLTSAMMMPFSPGLALGTLRTLARLQGRHEIAMTEEQPGRVLHEVRAGADRSIALGGDRIYYGSIDSTPLFVMLAGQAYRWGLPLQALAKLKPAVDRAIEWIEKYGDRDGDGLVEYQRSTDRGLANQGWKDSGDAMSHADGHLAEPPIVLAEVQGYCYAAFLAAADLEQALGDPGRATELKERAARVKERFQEAFWLEDEEFYAMALDGGKRPLRVLASNAGHCLWTGIVPEEFAGRIVQRLIGPDMFTGFGIRTLSSQSLRYNPVSYHNGSVWPHDTVLAAAGMLRYGYRDEAVRVIGGLLDALEAFDNRLPELFCGFARDDKPLPIAYPTSCSPQAWAAAVPFEILRVCLDMDARVPDRVLQISPVPATIGRVQLRGMPLGTSRIDVDADVADVTVSGLPGGLTVQRR